jgi:tRNA(Ile)-lysidine synthase
MLRCIHTLIERERMFTPGCRVGVAVSGGADSVCLLHVLRELAPNWNLHLEVLHLDHGLRGEASKGDAKFVRDLAAGLGLPFHEREAAAFEGNMEQAARAARREFFLEFVRAGRLDRIALGHTRDDQAETVLFRLLRGAGASGLAAMSPVTPEGLVRPLLDTRREEVEAYLAERGVAWREDATNRDTAFSRNRIRHELLPQLVREWNPNLVELLAQTAELAQEDEAYWRAAIERLAPEYLRYDPPAVILDGERLAAAPGSVARRMIRRAVETVKGDLRSVDFRHIDALLSLAVQDNGDGRVQIPGVDALRSFHQIRLAPPVADGLAGRNWHVALCVPGETSHPDGRSTICVETGGGRGYTEDGSGADSPGLTAPLELRNWRPGDQYQRVGRSGPEKVKTLFQTAKIPLWERRNWPIVSMGEEIIWARQFGMAAGCVLRISERFCSR